MQLPFPTALTAALRDRLALAELIIFAVLGLTHVPTHHAPVALVFWCALGVASARRDRGGDRGASSHPFGRSP